MEELCKIKEVAIYINGRKSFRGLYNETTHQLYTNPLNDELAKKLGYSWKEESDEPPAKLEGFAKELYERQYDEAWQDQMKQDELEYLDSNNTDSEEDEDF